MTTAETLTIKDIDARFNTEQIIAEVLQAQFPLVDHPGFRWKTRLSGYKDFTFGCRSGPIITLTALAHELAHAIEFGAASFGYRAQYGSFHFNAPTIWVIDRYCTEPTTSQMSEREARVFGIEARLLELFLKTPMNWDAYLQYCFEVRHFMPDCWFYDKRQSEFGELIHQSYLQNSQQHCLKELKRWFEKTHLLLSLQRLREQRERSEHQDSFAQLQEFPIQIALA